MNLQILYRGPLSSCNYGCPYCPFAKHHETRAEHAADGAALDRFLAWVAGRTDDQIGILITVGRGADPPPLPGRAGDADPPAAGDPRRDPDQSLLPVGVD